MNYILLMLEKWEMQVTQDVYIYVYILSFFYIYNKERDYCPQETKLKKYKSRYLPFMEERKMNGCNETESSRKNVWTSMNNFY